MSAGRWIEVQLSLARHPKMKRAARELGVSHQTMIGHLVCLWVWAVDQAPDGYVSAADVDDLAEEAGWGDDPDVFVKALAACGRDRPGFLEPVAGGWVIHDWHEHGGRAVVSHAEAVDYGSKGAHMRWHVKRERVDPDCSFCMDSNSPPNSPPIRGDEEATGHHDAATPPQSAAAAGNGADRPQDHNMLDPNSPPNSTDRQTDRTDKQTDRPTRAEAHDGADDGSTAKSRRKSRRAVTLPKDWSPNKSHRELARKEGVNCNREAIKFRAQAQATGRTLKDWDAGFTQWLLNANSYGSSRGNSTPPPPTAGPDGGVVG